MSIVVPIYKPQLNWLKDCVNSVISQHYSNWELILIDDHSDNPDISKYLQELSLNKKIKIIINPSNQNIVKSTNFGLKLATGEWVGFLDHDDILWPNALSEVVIIVNQQKNVQYLYTDQDKINEAEHHFDPFIKPDFDFKLIRQTNYVNHFSVIKRSLLTQLNNLRSGTDGAQDWDLILRASSIIKPSQFFHIKKILYSWRSSVNSTASSKGIANNKFNNISNVQRNVLEYDLKSRHQNSSVSQTRYIGIWSTDNQPTILPYQFYLKSLLNLITNK